MPWMCASKGHHTLTNYALCWSNMFSSYLSSGIYPVILPFIFLYIDRYNGGKKGNIHHFKNKAHINACKFKDLILMSATVTVALNVIIAEIPTFYIDFVIHHIYIFLYCN